MDQITDVAVPAICAWASMARELKFAKISPSRNMTPARSAMKMAKPRASSLARIAATAARTVKARTAACEIRLMPTRPDEARVEERGDRHHGRDRREGERKRRPEAEDVREDLLRRDEEAEDRAEHEPAGKGVAERLACREDLTQG